MKGSLFLYKGWIQPEAYHFGREKKSPRRVAGVDGIFPQRYNECKWSL
jgi:hypothetical protein